MQRWLTLLSGPEQQLRAMLVDGAQADSGNPGDDRFGDEAGDEYGPR